VAGLDNKTLFLIIPYQWAEFDIKQLERPTSDTDTAWIRLSSNNKKDMLELAQIRLSNDCLLQVGKSAEDREKILRHFRETFAGAVFPLVFLGLTGGVFLGFRALKPIRHLIDTIQSVNTGRMDARVPKPDTEDELATLVSLFNGMLEKIETLIRAMKGSLDNIAHDLRTPMARLRGMAERALQSRENDEAYKEALVGCMEESDLILKMLNALMDISEAETGVMKLNQETLNVSDLINRVLDMYHYIAEEKKIKIDVTVPGGLCVNADATRMSQALANLLDNAIKYTPQGGMIHLAAHEEQGEAVITVSDNGTGIARKELPRIWGRLYRGDQSRSQRGLGLGLSLVKAIVQAHKGRIEVVSEPHKGSTFTIHLPAGNRPFL
jgi:signal transduction histidine kinase